jgi:PhnB protein
MCRSALSRELTMQWNPYLSFNGQCEAAFKFYEQTLGGKIVMMMTYGDSPLAEKTPPALRNQILHATFALDDQVLAGADSPPGNYQQPQGFSVALSISDTAEADRIFATLAENGTVQTPLQETFWAQRFGMVVDQFGIPWMINCGKPA